MKGAPASWLVGARSAWRARAAWWLGCVAARLDRRACMIFVTGADAIVPADLPAIMERGTRHALAMVRHEAIDGIAECALRAARPELFRESN